MKYSNNLATRVGWRQLRYAGLAIVLAGVLSSVAKANDGLDPNFGFLGVNELNLSESETVESICTDGSGRIYVVGNTRKDILFSGIGGFSEDKSNHHIARFTSDGLIDPTFGGFGGTQPGVIVGDFRADGDSIYGVTTVPSGKLLSVGLFRASGESSLVVSRHLENGWLDESYGDLGRQHIPMPGTAYNGNMKRVNDKLYVWNSYFITRLNLDGTLDAGFGAGGVVMVADELSSLHYISDVAFNDGSLIVASGGKKSDDEKMMLFQLDSNGVRVGGFGVGGAINLTTHIPEGGSSAFIAVKDDLITVGCSSHVMRMDFAGNFDPTFDTDGIKVLNTNGMVRVDAVTGTETTLRDSDMDGSRLVTFAEAWEMPADGGPGESHPRLVALTENGVVDESFGDGGQIVEPVRSLPMASALEVHDGLVTVAGGELLMQLSSSGMLRGNFSMNGVAELFPECEVTDIQLMTYGRIAVSVKMPPLMGNSYSVARLLQDGTPDPMFSHTTFGVPVDGWMTATYGHAAFAKKLFAYANGKLLVGGDFRYDVEGEAGQDIILMRLHNTSEGTPERDPDGFDPPGAIVSDQLPNRDSHPARTTRS